MSHPQTSSLSKCTRRLWFLTQLLLPVHFCCEGFLQGGAGAGHLANTRIQFYILPYNEQTHSWLPPLDPGFLTTVHPL